MTLYEEWVGLAGALQNVYIFGTGTVGVKLFALLGEMGKRTIVRGFVVSLMSGENEMYGVPVLRIDEVFQKEADILVSVSEVYHPEVYDLLRQYHTLRIIPAHKYYNLDLKSTAHTYKELIDHSRDAQIPGDLLAFRDSVVSEYQHYSHAFGENQFYQSFPRLGILGNRPTEVRIAAYGLKEYLTGASQVLDIGCNCGFLDLEIAGMGGHVVGIEYNDNLVDIALRTAKALGIKNVDFISSDYNRWKNNNKERFDMIFSFAVHAWLNVEPADYAAEINGMLNSGGHVILESQTLKTDKRFYDYVEAFQNRGLVVVNDELIKDDGRTERRFLIFAKGQPTNATAVG